MSSQPRSTALQTSRQLDRPRSHRGTSDAETTIFDATERLLAQIPLHDISVADIIKEAQISRATFYFYFSSKFAVVSGLLARVMDDIYEVVQPFVGGTAEESAEETLRRSLGASVDVWFAHGPALRAAHEHWHAVPELREQWLAVVERFTDAVAGQIDRERKAGLAPKGPNSRRLAATLLWATDRCLYIASSGADPSLSGAAPVIDVLISLWLGGIYGDAPPNGTARGSRRRTSPSKRRS
jgi:AcrR family transcriptional regulator